MKKVFFLIALSIMVLSIVPQIMAQDTARMEEIQRQMQQVQADMVAGRITPQQAVTRIEQLNAEFETARTAREQSITGSTTAFTPAQLQRIEVLFDQSKTLEANRHDGRINQAQYDRQIATVNQELQSIYNTVNSPMARTQLEEIEKRIEAIWPGRQPGWPPADGIDSTKYRYTFGPFTQVSGTKASYSIDNRGSDRANRPRQTDYLGGYSIYQTSDRPDFVFQEMRRQIERLIGRTMQRLDNTTYDLAYHINMQHPYMPEGYSLGINLTKDGNTVRIMIGEAGLGSLE